MIYNSSKDYDFPDKQLTYDFILDGKQVTNSCFGIAVYARNADISTKF